MSTSSGDLTGLGVPSYHLTGLTHAKRSNFCRRATLRLLIPPPTGVVSGPFIEIRPVRIASNVSSGNHSPVLSNAFCPAKTSRQWIFLDSEYAFSTAAFTTSIITGVMSIPIPSPSI